MASAGSQASSGDKVTLVAGGQLRTGRVHMRKDKTDPRRIAYLILLLFATPPGWPLFVIGATLVIAAVLFHGWAAGYLARAGYQEREKILTVRGPYRHNRNPYYAAHLTMDFGFFCVAGLPLLYLLYFPVIYAVYRRWVMNEEPFLEAEFGDDYRRFKHEVPRWRVRVTPAPPRGGEQTFSWGLFKLNNEWPRAGSHLLILVILSCYFFFGNPWAGVDPLVRATMVGAIAGWLVTRDIYPLDVSRVHAGWIALAALIGIGGALFITVAPVWAPWSSMASWFAVVVGIALGLIVSLLTLPAVARVTGKTLNDIFSQPMSQWYTLGLGLGLLTLTLGGVWVGILVPLAIWSLGLAGVAPMKPIQCSAAIGFGLLSANSALALYAVAQLVA